MIRTLAVEGYRSLRSLTLGLGNLTVVTGANGSGKTSVYRALRLLADVARDGAVSSLAREGGMRSAMHAGPRPTGPVAVRLGVATEDLSYAIDLGLPQLGPFRLDPEIKSEVVWAGPVLRPSTILTERTGSRVRTRDDDGAWTTVPLTVHAHESVMALLADPAATPDLFALREQARRWRFYDHLRTDADSPARRPGVATFTPVLSPTGDDLAAALMTIERIGDADALQASVDVAFPGLPTRRHRGRRRRLPGRDDAAGSAATALGGRAVRRHPHVPAARRRGARHPPTGPAGAQRAGVEPAPEPDAGRRRPGRVRRRTFAGARRHARR